MAIIEGKDQLDREIERLIRKLDGEATERAISVAGEVILRAVESEIVRKDLIKTGFLKASLRLGHYADRSASHGRTRVYKASISVPNSKRFGIAHYAVFLEYGTSKMKRKSFMRPAFDSSKAQAVKEFERVLYEELRK
ncbi:MAG: hypothetical protein NTW48_00270 [Chloroflexi bacterium]|nr:hypothetical protein [Chloroflexota bacterium]